MVVGAWVQDVDRPQGALRALMTCGLTQPPLCGKDGEAVPTVAARNHRAPDPKSVRIISRSVIA